MWQVPLELTEFELATFFRYPTREHAPIDTYRSSSRRIREIIQGTARIAGELLHELKRRAIFCGRSGGPIVYGYPDSENRSENRVPGSQAEDSPLTVACANAMKFSAVAESTSAIAARAIPALRCTGQSEIGTRLTPGLR